MEFRINSRNYKESFISGRHLELDDLIEAAEARGLSNQYLYKDYIPPYPRPEFHVSHLQHDTENEGLRGIWRDLGFKAMKGCSLVWWSLAVGLEEMRAAERRILEKHCPDQNPDQTPDQNPDQTPDQTPDQNPDQTPDQNLDQQSFLVKFASSPSFLQTSRLGSYRFTFPLDEVLEAYRDQVCSGEEPVLRVFETVLYKQEVMYSVLVHSPDQNQVFSDRFPLLPDDPHAVCSYRDRRFIWRSQAMCETHRYELKHRPDENLMEAEKVEGFEQFYVWDNVAVALHMERGQVLKFHAGRLRQNLNFCYPDAVTMIHEWEFDTKKEAEELVRRLWPGWEGPLQEAPSLEEAPSLQEASSLEEAPSLQEAPSLEEASSLQEAP